MGTAKHCLVAIWNPIFLLSLYFFSNPPPLRFLILRNLHERLPAGYHFGQPLPEQTAPARQITATDTQIDRLVYDLYGLTEEEKNLVNKSY